jgi:hypothetical protein
MNARVLVFVLTALLAAVPTAQADSIKLPPGTKTKLHGQTSSVYLDNGVSGTFDCSCAGVNATGTCSLSVSGGLMICGKGKTDTCNAECNLVTTTKGLSGAMAARMHAVSGAGATVGPMAH